MNIPVPPAETDRFHEQIVLAQRSDALRNGVRRLSIATLAVGMAVGLTGCEDKTIGGTNEVAIVQLQPTPEQ